MEQTIVEANYTPNEHGLTTTVECFTPNFHSEDPLKDNDIAIHTPVSTETEIPSTDNKENPLVTHIHSYSDDHISQRAPKMHSTPTHMIRKTCASTINRASTVCIELKGKNNAHII